MRKEFILLFYMFQIYVRKMSSTVKRTDARAASHEWTALMPIKKG